MQVTNLNIGKCGERWPYGLGNQMFQIASAIGIAKAHGNNCTWGFPSWECNKYFQFTLPHIMIGAGLPIKEVSFDYTPVKFEEKYQLIFLDGYFQSWKYFEQAEKEVREAFTFKHECLQPVKIELENAELGMTCSIHVRRGDYLNYPDIHHSHDNFYWRQAMFAIEEGYPIDTYIIFSDDIPWIKEHLNEFKSNTKAKVIVFEGRSQIDDLIAMSLCNHNIIANSTFSWWGAWLNQHPDKRVVMPEKWFGAKGPTEGKDLRVPGWIIK